MQITISEDGFGYKVVIRKDDQNKQSHIELDNSLKVIQLIAEEFEKEEQKVIPD